MDQPQELESKALALVDEARALQIVDQASFELADKYLSRNKAMQKTWLDFTQPNVDAANAAADTARDIRDRVIKPLKEWELGIKAKMGAWFREQESARLEAERRANEEARLAAAVEAEQAGENSQADAILNGDVTVAPVILPSVKAQVKASFRENWTFKITDQAIIPREYLIPDMTKIGQLVRALKGQTKIPGVVAFAEQVVAGRR